MASLGTFLLLKSLDLFESFITLPSFNIISFVDHYSIQKLKKY